MILLMGFCITGSSNTCQAAQLTQVGQSNFDTTIADLKKKFPHGKYWNHVGMTTDNSNGYTSSACTKHKSSGVDHVKGTGGCTCNHFAGGGHLSATQCMGFANKLGYDVFGYTTWIIKYDNPSANVQVGDIVRYASASDNTTGHSVFVIAKSGNEITVGEANYGGACRINWGRTIDLTKVTVQYYEHAANYASVMGATTATPATTPAPATKTDSSGQTAVNNPSENQSGGSAGNSTDSTKTGWEKAEDGIHYCYLEKGVVQKKKWLKIGKKKYYVDKNGYRMTGFGDIGSYTYYFSEEGELQKDQWFDVDEKSYYVNKDGIVLKSQWLYKNNVRVYVTGDGSVATNTLVKIGGKTYYFNAKGKRSKGFKKYNGKYYYTDKNGIVQKKKWITKSGKKYYLQKSGVRAQNKILKIGKYSYYFNAQGQMAKKETIEYAGAIYKVDKKGRCKFVRNVAPEE